MTKNKSLWYPYAQMKFQNNYEVEKAEGVYLHLKNGDKLIDGISSWWSTIYGYNNKKLNNAMTKQMEKFAHIMLGGLTHEPAIRLSEKLVEITPKGLNHVFFSDSGSVGVEVAIKMAIQYYSNKDMKEKTKILSLTRSYHGDTIKAMEIGDDPDYHGSFSHVFNKTFHTTVPESGFNAKTEDLEDTLNELNKILEKNHKKIACFIVEPILQGAGGMNIYSPVYLEKAYELCKKYDILLIFDEVATGFGRTGEIFATNYTNIVPDIMVLGKALTGGYTGHAATLTSTEVFEAFYGDTYEEAFMHGPTFMGNAVACAVALQSIDIFIKENYIDKIKKIEKTLAGELENFSHKKIKEVRVLGAMGVIEVYDNKDLKGFQEYTMKRGVWLRPFDKYLYTMPQYVISEKELKKITSVMKDFFI